MRFTVSETGITVSYRPDLIYGVLLVHESPLLIRLTEPRGYDKVPTMIVFEDDKVKTWGFDVLTNTIEPKTNPVERETSLHLYKLFKPLFDSQNDSDKSEAKKCASGFLEALLEHLKKELKGQLPTGQGWDKSTVKFLFSYPTTWNPNTRDRFSRCIKEAGYKMVDS